MQSADGKVVEGMGRCVIRTDATPGAAAFPAYSARNPAGEGMAPKGELPITVTALTSHSLPTGGEPTMRVAIPPLPATDTGRVKTIGSAGALPRIFLVRSSPMADSSSPVAMSTSAPRPKVMRAIRSSYQCLECGGTPLRHAALGHRIGQQYFGRIVRWLGDMSAGTRSLSGRESRRVLRRLGRTR